LKFYEIQSKQGASRGLTIVNDDVFIFFIQLNGVVQHNCTFEHFHIHGQKTFTGFESFSDFNK
jgi:hypothetical protein